MPSTPAQAQKALTSLDHRIEAAVGHSIDTLWKQRDREILDEPRARLVDAHRDLVQAETSVTFYRTLLHRLASGEYPVDAALFTRIDRTVGQLEEAAATRDEREAKVRTALDPVEAAATTQTTHGDVQLSAPDFAALLAIARGANLHQHLLTGRLSLVTASGERLVPSTLDRLETAGLVERDTSHPLHAGQPVTLTDAGRTTLSGSRRPGTAAPAPAQRAGAWPAASRPRR
ncbi:hypothetical protein ACIRQP_35115 [Streptomyces sp. NPDC102274]|uniref:hypothetical protein n=1 Tax=Streptomyces sp. NPDC102274 TaxID=3366151 RepID=UPI00382C8F8B